MVKEVDLESAVVAAATKLAASFPPRFLVKWLPVVIEVDLESAVLAVVSFLAVFFLFLFLA
jgi:hypothetical protein